MHAEMIAAGTTPAASSAPRRPRGRPVLPVRKLEDMFEPNQNAHPLRLTELIGMTGFSRQKLIADIQEGYLKAAPARCRRKFTWRVPFEEGRRYLRALKLIP